MPIEQWLSEQIKATGLKQKFIAEKCGIPGFTETKLSCCLTGRRKIQADEYLSVCLAAGIDPFGYPPLRALKEEANA